MSDPRGRPTLRRDGGDLGSPEEAGLQEQFGRLEDRLVKEFGGPETDEMVRRILAAARAEFDGARVRRFLPILVERAARGRLRET